MSPDKQEVPTSRCERIIPVHVQGEDIEKMREDSAAVSALHVEEVKTCIGKYIRMATFFYFSDFFRLFADPQTLKLSP